MLKTEYDRVRFEEDNAGWLAVRAELPMDNDEFLGVVMKLTDEVIFDANEPLTVPLMADIIAFMESLTVGETTNG